MQIIIVGTIEVGEIDLARIREGKVANRIVLGEDHGSASILNLSLHRRGRSGGNKEARKRAQETRGCNIKLGLEIIKMLIAAFAC